MFFTQQIEEISFSAFVGVRNCLGNSIFRLKRKTTEIPKINGIESIFFAYQLNKNVQAQDHHNVPG